MLCLIGKTRKLQGIERNWTVKHVSRRHELIELMDKI